MIAEFRDAVSAHLASAQELEQQLVKMPASGWSAVAEVFAARLPEFDLVLGRHGLLAEQVAKARGVPLLVLEQSGGRWSFPAAGSGQAVLITPHLQDGQLEEAAILEARASGIKVPIVGAAVERTSLGARRRLEALGCQVRAVLQLADTPQGLVYERRPPERWLAAEALS